MVKTKLKSLILFLMIILGLGIKNISANAVELQQRMFIDSIVNNMIFENKDIKVEGWALNSSGVKAINIYVDDKNFGTAQLGISRPDVSYAFPGYPNGDTSGYSYLIDKNTIMQGKHKITVEVIGNNGLKQYDYRYIEVKKAQLRMYLDKPQSDKIYTRNFKIEGWALNPSKTKAVTVYVNGEYRGNAVLGGRRADVNMAFPGYPEGEFSGYSFDLALKDTDVGTSNVLIEAIGNDGSKVSINKVMEFVKLQQRGFIDSPSQIVGDNNDVKISGWVLNQSGIKYINVYFDNILKGQANKGESRKDVLAAFPQYIEAENSGYSYTIPISQVTEGMHQIVVEAIGNDGTSYKITRQLEMRKLIKRGFIDEPAPQVNNNKDIRVSGWTLNPVGVSSIEVYLDGRILGNANINESRQDVNQAFPEYSSQNSGYSYVIPYQAVPEGIHTVTIKVIGKDKSEYIMDRSFNKEIILPSVGNIDLPSYGAKYKSGNTIRIAGWALNKSAVKEVKIFIDQVYRGNAQVGLTRADVGSAFSDYTNANQSGYEFQISSDLIPTGKHLLVAQAIGNDGSIDNRQIMFVKSTIIVIDPGHNFAGDDGAYASHDGVTYVERDLNMQVSAKLKRKLEDLGFEVVMTRNENERPTDDLLTSLAKRVEIANNSGADLMISIHHDSNSSSSVNGVSTHWSSWRPNIDASGVIEVNDIKYDTTPCQAAVNSGELAKSIVDGLSRDLNYVNRGSSDHNLYVTRNTNMTSLLVECGFISNKQEAKRSADPNNQNLLAAKLAEIIYKYFNK